ncbi:MAG: hypothetical protein NTV62_00850 [Candidatus Gribaldobacteria bacterium]|nr:hypothetical protein [Candidatus Gribaldobacteria bacterium]
MVGAEKINFNTESHENFSQLKDEVRFGSEMASKLNENNIQKELLGDINEQGQFQGDLAQVLESLTQKKSKPKKGEEVLTSAEQMAQALLEKGYFNGDQKIAQENCQKILSQLELKIVKDADLAEQDPNHKRTRIANNLLLGGIRGMTYFTVGGVGTALGGVLGGVGSLGVAKLADRYIVNGFKKSSIEKHKAKIGSNKEGLKQNLASDLAVLISQNQREQLLIKEGLPKPEDRTIQQHYEDTKNKLQNTSNPEKVSFNLTPEQIDRAAQMIAIEQAMENETRLQEQELAQRKGQWPNKILGKLKGFNDLVKPGGSSEKDFANRAFATTAWSFGVGLCLREAALNVPFLKEAIMMYGGARGGYALSKLIFDRGKTNSENIAKEALSILDQESAKKTDFKENDYKTALARARLALAEMKKQGKSQIETTQLEKQIKQYEFQILNENMLTKGSDLDTALENYKGEDIQKREADFIKADRRNKMAGKLIIAGLGAVAAPIIGDRLADIAKTASSSSSLETSPSQNLDISHSPSQLETQNLDISPSHPLETSTFRNLDISPMTDRQVGNIIEEMKKWNPDFDVNDIDKIYPGNEIVLKDPNGQILEKITVKQGDNWWNIIKHHPDSFANPDFNEIAIYKGTGPTPTDLDFQPPTPSQLETLNFDISSDQAFNSEYVDPKQPTLDTSQFDSSPSRNSTSQNIDISPVSHDINYQPEAGSNQSPVDQIIHQHNPLSQQVPEISTSQKKPLIEDIQTLPLGSESLKNVELNDLGINAEDLLTQQAVEQLQPISGVSKDSLKVAFKDIAQAVAFSEQGDLNSFNDKVIDLSKTLNGGVEKISEISEALDKKLIDDFGIPPKYSIDFSKISEMKNEDLAKIHADLFKKVSTCWSEDKKFDFNALVSKKIQLENFIKTLLNRSDSN